MKLVRFGEMGKEKPGVLTENGIIDLKAIYPEIPDVSASFFADGWVKKITDLTHGPTIDLNTRLGAPISHPSKIICLGKNYMEHAKEGGFETPKEPLLFCKTSNTLNGPFDPIKLPESDQEVDWEVELAIVIGKQGKKISRTQASDFIVGFTVMNDVSGRRAQFSDGQWFRGKSFDTFAPIGPCIATWDTVGTLDDIHNLKLASRVNNNIMQEGNTKDLIFDIPFIVEYISRDITLYPGDIISTGTPAGVGYFRDPKILLKSGDVVECQIEKIGAIKNCVQ